MRRLIIIWIIIVLTYTISLIAIVFWPLIFNTVTNALRSLDELSSGYGTPLLIILIMIGIVATMYHVVANYREIRKKEVSAIHICAGTMCNNIFTGPAEREARRVFSEYLSTSNPHLVDFAPSQKDIGRHVRKVKW